jgi:hypothetical protein
LGNVRALFNSAAKGVQADSESGLWPAVRTLSPRLANYSPLTNYFLFNDRPQWKSLHNIQSLFDWYHSNPILYAVVMIKAREYANMDILVMSRSNPGVPIKRNTQAPIPRALYKFFDRPNVLQSKWNFLLQRKIMKEVGGNSFTYGNFALSPRPNVQFLVSLWNIWPQHVQYKLKNSYFDAISVNDIIESWMFKAGDYKKEWQAWEVLHTCNPNTEIMDDRIFGRSAAQNLVRPLSNIDMAYESRNVIMRNRGMRVIMSSGKKDMSGAIPLDKEEKEAVQEDMKSYGMLEGQKQFFLTDMPVSVTPIDQDVQKLGLFEEIATDAIAVCNGYGVPEILLKMYLKGATFENQVASVRRLYEGTLIPEAEDDLIALSNFLGLNETDYYLYPSFAHVPVLQESEELKEKTAKLRSDRLLGELAQKLITPDEYRTALG